MEIIRDPGVISGFRFENPLADLPSLTHCGEAFAGPSHVVLPQTHPAFEFHYMVKGSIHWRIEKAVHPLREGEVSWTPPDLEHESIASHRDEHHILWIGIKIEQLGDEGAELIRGLRDLAARQIYVFPVLRDVELVLRGILLQIVERRGRVRDACAQYLHLFVTLLLQALEAERSGSPPRDVRPYCYAVIRALQYMQEHLDERIPLETLARVSGLGRSQLSSRFLQEVGISPAAYHLQQRLEAARAVLMNPEMSITQVALEFGFSSSQHFTRAFGEAFGMAPLSWQRAHASTGNPRQRAEGRISVKVQDGQ
jgi:AraC-like DNA-binding protein